MCAACLPAAVAACPPTDSSPPINNSSRRPADWQQHTNQ